MYPDNKGVFPLTNASNEKKDIYQAAIDREKVYSKWVKIEEKHNPNLGSLPFNEITRKYNEWLKKENIDRNGNPLTFLSKKP